MRLTRAEYIKVIMQFCVENKIEMKIGEFSNMINKGYEEYLLHG